MNMNIWNLSRRNPRLLAAVLIESSCQLKTRRVVQWRVLFSGAGESEQRRGGRTWRWCETPEAGGSNKFFFFCFFLNWKDTFRCGGTGGSQSRSSLFYSSQFIRLIRRKLHEGKFWANSLEGERNQYPSILCGSWAHRLLPTSQWDETGNWGGACGRLRHRCHVKRGVTRVWGLDPESRSGWTDPVERLTRAAESARFERSRRFDVEESEKEKANAACKSEWGLSQRSNCYALR